MKLWLVIVVAVMSSAALADDTCKLLEERPGVRVWQCSPTPASTAAPSTPSQTITMPSGDKK